jgi:hypothetical protein
LQLFKRRFANLRNATTAFECHIRKFHAIAKTALGNAVNGGRNADRLDIVAAAEAPSGNRFDICRNGYISFSSKIANQADFAETNQKIATKPKTQAEGANGLPITSITVAKGVYVSDERR